ncbi:TPA: single-stranded DNA-binding protein [Patescibacteria group bacterium]|uniref:Single-stranded DNA-binding protein n=2 Tax=Bacteria division Kazan-3B-28 TaxID=1798534 RepID=A0A0G1N1Y0_UNCK3|nr:MAG: Single-stranded DNA-binding protein [candidate division Kazan bacterium GW2011_GWA1_44_22]KKT87082.1 MAG: Single-stranded DNA-binding protein [candidate division Kazan bacterium GW2011_GWB1_45_10]HAR54743.1 single-stranded DNA-binding protein [Patescibacteria group bacterium]HCR41830.1 single-stranded DNA-binding protein [Patescibacteria group bacterium]
MRDLNKVMLIGNMTRDPEIRTIPSGQSVASFSVATNRSWNDNAGELQKAVEYTDIVAWGKLAEIAGQILKKGRRVYIEGRLQTRNWEGQDNVKRYKTEVIASDLIVLDKPQGISINGNNAAPATELPDNNTTNTPELVTQTVAANSVPTPIAGQTAEEIDIEDIPF